MSSELLGAAQNVLKGNLGGAWDINKGYADAYTDLGIGRRFGGSAAAYSLRDVGAMNGGVVKVRRDVDGQGSDPEEDFSANQVSSGALEDWVNGKLENTLPADVATAAAAYSLRKVKSDYTGYAVRIRRTVNNTEVNVAFDSEDKVSLSSTILQITGSTNATTLGEFLTEDSVNYNAFVHTWYDQAGSNHAVQSTSANQPQIADTGALLADGLLFDDSNDFLQSSTQVLTGTTNNSIYCVVKTLSDNGYIAGSAGTGVGMSIYAGTTKFILSNNNTAGASTQDNISMVNNQTVLISANFDDGTTDSLHLNSYANGYANGSSSYSITAGTKFTIGARDGSTAEAVMYKGSIQEIIAYDSFQGANRFKIESNINNYYGLYNDANDLSSTSFTVSGGTLSGSNTTDGFTCTTTTSSEVRANFKNTIPSLSSNSFTFHMSFNADIANPAGSSGNGSPIVRLLNSSEAVTTAAHTVTQGFNSFSNVVNQNAGTDSTILEFFDNDANTSYSISDIKISRIARNGFVETWYDQSNNGKDITQGTAGDQPKIVLNGSLITSANGLPAISFADDAVTLERSEFLTGQLSAYFFVYDAEAADSGEAQVILRQGSDFRIGAAVETNGKVRANIRDNTPDSIFLDAGGDLATGGTLLQSIFIRARGANGMYNYVDGANEKVGDSTDIQDVDFSSVDSGDFSIGANAGGAFDFKGKIQEAIFFESDLFTDKSTIETELNNHYNAF